MKLNQIFILLILLFIPVLTDGNTESDNNFSKIDTYNNINPLSLRSLFIKQFRGDVFISNATGFIVEDNNKKYLITNWHVLSGRDPITNKVVSKTIVTPDRINIYHHGDKLGTWKIKQEKLYNKSNKRLWLEHKQGSKVDLVALPLKNLKGIKTYSFNLNLADTDVIPEVAMTVSIIGFPFGLSAPGLFPIWKTGHIASEPMIDYWGKPLFLIDATTRGGMSGSPVVLRISGRHKTRGGKTIIASSGIKTLFMGVYSGRIAVAEIGKVWRPYLIKEIINQ